MYQIKSYSQQPAEVEWYYMSFAGEEIEVQRFLTWSKSHRWMVAELGSNRDHLAFTTYSYVEIINVHQHWSSPGQMAFLYSLHKSQQTVKGCNFADHALSVATTHLCPCSTRAAINNMQENECNRVPVKHIYKIKWRPHLTHRVQFTSIVLVVLALSLLVGPANFMVLTPPNSFTSISHGVISSSIISITVALMCYVSLSIRCQPVVTGVSVLS